MEVSIVLLILSGLGFAAGGLRGLEVGASLTLLVWAFQSWAGLRIFFRSLRAQETQREWLSRTLQEVSDEKGTSWNRAARKMGHLPKLYETAEVTSLWLAGRSFSRGSWIIYSSGLISDATEEELRQLMRASFLRLQERDAIRATRGVMRLAFWLNLAGEKSRWLSWDPQRNLGSLRLGTALRLLLLSSFIRFSFRQANRRKWKEESMISPALKRRLSEASARAIAPISWTGSLQPPLS